MFDQENRLNTLNGIWFTALFALASMYLSNIPVFKQYAISPLIIAILLGIAYGNSLRNKLPEPWIPGIRFATKTLLRLGIILYGFKITVQELMGLGAPGLIVSIIMAGSTFLLGWFFGTRVLRMDRDLSILTAAGSSICGAAAVLATEPVLKAEPYKSAVAVSTVVLFGTISMLLYPVLFNSGLMNMDPGLFGVYIGGTVHEVAHVVAAGNAVGADAAASSIIVKMARVMLLAPMLILLGISLAVPPEKNSTESGNNDLQKRKIIIPWFAVGFIAVALFNSMHILPEKAVDGILYADSMLLTMAMAALGMETSREKIKQAGLKPIYLAGTMYVWLLFGGYFVTNRVMGFCLSKCNLGMG